MGSPVRTRRRMTASARQELLLDVTTERGFHDVSVESRCTSGRDHSPARLSPPGGDEPAHLLRRERAPADQARPGRRAHHREGRRAAGATHQGAARVRRQHAALMKGVVCENAKLEVAEVPEPEPAAGQVLLDVKRCGICGSDLHARRHADLAADVLAEAGYEGFMRSDQRVVFGHEFCGEVAEYGPRCRKKVESGTPVVALPLTRRGGDVHAIGLSAHAPGAYAEQVVVEESLMLPLTNGLAPDVGVLTEPMAIGRHAVRRAEIGKREVAIVIGCGPVGLAVICMLKAQGVRTVVASDFSRGRRDLAAACGANIVVDPAEDSPYEAAG